MSANSLPNPQAIFYQQYESVRRDEVVGVLLALFLGGFGAHHFYLRRNGLGILYLCLCWTPFPWFMGFIGCFFMPGRVRIFNAVQASLIAQYLGLGVPPWNYAMNMPQEAAVVLNACSRCQASNVAGASYCSACGQPLG